MNLSFEISVRFPVNSVTLFNAWLDSKEHTNMTGGEAECSSEVGGEFSTWDGYIFGRNLLLTRDKEIVQSWRTTEFQEEDEDSEITLKFEDIEGGCLLTLHHENIPEGQPDYEQGWVDHYFLPMKEYFNINLK